jgi:hypothetical protein
MERYYTVNLPIKPRVPRLRKTIIARALLLLARR